MSDQDDIQRKLLDAYISEGRDRVDDYRRPDLLELAHKNAPLSLELGIANMREQHALNWETPINPIIQGAGIPSTFNATGDLGPGLNIAEATLWANASAHSIPFGTDGYTDGTNLGLYELFFSLDVVLFPTGDCTFTTYLDLIDKDSNPLLTYQIDTVCVGFVFTSTYTRPTITIPSFNGFRTRVTPNQPGLRVLWFAWYVLGSITPVVL